MSSPEPIAVVGMGCRFPGANNLDEFWRVLTKGENHVKEVPPSRWNVDAFYDPDPDAPGKTYVRKVGLVTGHDEFDNRLFDINDIETAKMDPQQRFVLESTFMALEDGGFLRADLSGSNTGVYVGVMNHDYMDILSSDMTRADNYNLTGGTTSIAAARVSYVYNLLGPSMVVDTACSSSLIAIHLGSQSIRAGDCDMAICGGVNCIMLPEIFIPLSKARMVSPTGASQAFSDTADGYARGEGCGMVILKKLSDALESGDKVWGVVMTASNQDGRTATPITAPSALQQSALLQKAYGQYNIKATEMQYLEAHGTGTPVGDPIEANSLGAFFGSDERELYMGSVKTNIGHLESAAGIAGLIKVLLMMKYKTIVPSLHFSTPNPKINLEAVNMTIPTELLAWEAFSDGSRLACVNSFGFGGSNAHAIVQHNESWTKDRFRDGYPIVVVTGVSEQALKSNISHLLDRLDAEPIDVRSLSFTSTCRRDHYPYRLAIAPSNVDDLKEQLKLPLTSNLLIRKDRINLIFVFGGMGTFWKGMYRELMQREVVFRDTIKSVDKLLQPFCTINVEGEILNSSNLQDPMVGPVVLFASQVALVAVWRHWGIEPDTFIGQSVGEVAAAYASGKLTLADAVTVIYNRTKLLSTVTGGKMLMVKGYPVTKVKQLCDKMENKPEIALYYSPLCCTVSGEDDDINSLAEILQEESKDINVFFLNVTTAFHSFRMEPLINPLEQALSSLVSNNFSTSNIISTVTGNVAEESDFVTPEYWSQNLRQPVQFHQGVLNCLRENEANVFLEIGSKPVLKYHQKDICNGDDIMVLPSVVEGSDVDCMLSSLCKLFQVGIHPNWKNLVPIGCPPGIEPQYQFQRKTLLYQPTVSQSRRSGLTPTGTYHPFIKQNDDDCTTYTVDINGKQTPFVYQHGVKGKLVVQGTVFVELGLFIGSKYFSVPKEFVKPCVYLVQPFKVQLEQSYTLTCSTKVESENSISFCVFNKKSVYAYGHVSKNLDMDNVPVPDLESVQSRCSTTLTKEDLYESLSSRDLQYGTGLSIVSNIWANSQECICEIEINDLILDQVFQTSLHPVILDAMAQSTCSIVESNENDEKPKTMLPSKFGAVTVFQNLTSKMICYVKVVEKRENESSYNMLLFSHTGVIIANVKDFVVKATGEKNVEIHHCAFAQAWSNAPEGITRINDADYKVALVCDDIYTIEGFTKCIPAIKTYHSPVSDYNNLNFENFYLNCFADVVTESDEDLVSGLMFAQMSNLVKTNGLTNDTFQQLIQVFSNLKDVILFLSERTECVPLFVLTYCTQVVDGSESININGSQLWGMIRCVIQEGFFQNVYLIDVDNYSKETSDAIKYIMRQASNQETVSKEIGIRGGKIFYSTITHCSGDSWDRQFCPHPWNGIDNVEMFSHLRLPKDDKTSLRPVTSVVNRDKDQVSGTLGSFLIQKMSFFPRIADSDETVVWPDIQDADSTIFTIEAEIHVSKLNEPLVACFPMKVATNITVSECATVPVSRLPNYKPGMLSLLLLAWHLQEYIKTRQQVSIITNECTFVLGKTLGELLRLFGFKKLNLYSYQETTYQNCLSSQTLILLCDSHIDVKHENAFLQQIIGIEGITNNSVMNLSKHANINSIQISPKKIFLPFKLRNTVPKVKHFLEKNRKALSNIFANLPASAFDVFSSGVGDLRENHSLDVLVTKHTMFRQNGSYLVVGGLGGLGWITVCIIAQMGGGLVATMCRKPPTADMLRRIEELKARTKVEVVCLQADVTDKISVEKSLTALKTDHPGYLLKGIFQGAGVLDDSILLNMNQKKVQKVVSPKIEGTWNLHHASLKYHLDYFVMHSSVVSILGNPGQSNYGAGNSFMDTFAHFRRQQNLHGLSINWGPLEVGMAQGNESIAQQLQKVGYLSLGEEEIKECLIHAILCNTTQICYMDFDWPDKHKQILQTLDIRDTIRYKSRNTEEEMMTQLDLEILCKQPVEIRYNHLFEYTVQVLSSVLAVDSTTITSATDLAALGVDSMLAMTLSNQFRRDLHIKVPIDQLLDDTSVQCLIMNLDTKICGIEEKEEFKVNISSDIIDLNSSGLSPIQDLIYLNHMKTEGKNDLTFAVEVSVSGQIPDTFLREAICSVLMRNSQLRALFKEENGRVSVHFLQEPDVSKFFVTVSCKPEEMWEMTCKNAKEHFNLSTEIPIRVLFLQTENAYRLGFVFHQISFDLKSMQLFFKELKDVCISKAKGEPEVFVHVDVPLEIQHAVQASSQQLSKFWQAIINKNTFCPKISFGENNVESLFGSYESVIKNISRESIQQITSFNGKVKVTPFQLFVSIQQLLMHLSSKERHISLKTLVDLRLHIPALQETVGRCANAVPLITEIHPEMEIMKYLLNNAKAISDYVKHGLYPQHNIVEKISQENANNLFRHSIVLEDMSEFTEVIQDSKKYGFDMLNYGPVNTSSETRLVIWSDRRQKTLKLQLDYLPSIVSQETAEAILQSHIQLMEWVIRGEGSQISDIPLFIYEKLLVSKKMTNGNGEIYSSHISKCPAEYMTSGGYFTKIGRNGIEKRVFLKMWSNPDFLCLRWGDSETSLSKQLPLCKVKKICWNLLNGCHLLILRTNSRRYYFIADSKEDARRWIDGFKVILQNDKH